MALTTIATTTSGQQEGAASTDALHSEYSIDTMEYVRGTTDPVPGGGPVRGVWMYKGVTYAFRDDELGLECLMYKSSGDGWELVTTPTLFPGGKYEFINHNFQGATYLQNMYGVDGVNKGFFFDGATFTQVTTGMVADAPTHLIAHKFHLFYVFPGGSVQHSSPGDPTAWSPILGAAELALGQDSTGFLGLPGQALAIYARNATFILKGSGVADWELDTFDEEAGAAEWSLQRFKYPLVLDDRGITNLQAVQDFGDFRAKTLSQKFQKVIDQLKPLLVTSLRVRTKDHYRLFFSDGRILTIGVDGTKIIGALISNYGLNIVTAVSVENLAGKEILLGGSDNGYVYRLDSGNNFDGEQVDAWIRPVFNHFKTPENKKRFFKSVLEIDAPDEVTLQFIPEFDYSNPDLPSAVEGSMDANGSGGIWGESGTIWGEFEWGGQLVSTAEGYIDGTGSNLSLFIRSMLTYEAPYTIQGTTIHYSVRGIKR